MGNCLSDKGSRSGEASSTQATGNGSASKQVASAISAGPPSKAGTEVSALKAQLSALQNDNAELRKELADLSGKLQERGKQLQEANDEVQTLQSRNQELEQLLAALRKDVEAKSLHSVHLTEELGSVQQKATDLRKAYEQLESANHNLKRRLSDLSTGHASTSAVDVQPVVPQGDHPDMAMLVVLRNCNPRSKLPEAWKSAEFKRWEGVRMENGQVTGLAINGLQVTVVPPELGSLRNLKALLLSNNGITSLPTTVGNLVHLTYLLVDGNHLTSLPQEVTQLSQLQTLWAQDNNLTGLPEGIGHLTNLRQLLLNNNDLTKLPDDIGELQSLCSLWLDGNKFETLPEAISKLTSLHRLRVDPQLVDLLPPHVQGITETPQGSASTSKSSGS
mmetsp:Transcript_34280/g.76047  ORF Transcript_34280/g.76047 Transcript_34280/m.76047 type:complete len:390 (-) Transcript_34280:2214-3383(-)